MRKERRLLTYVEDVHPEEVVVGRREIGLHLAPIAPHRRLGNLCDDGVDHK
jgi:hypothetical protein